MAELEIDQSHLPRVQEVCQCFAVLEDGVLAHNLQEQEIEQYYTTNIQKNQLVQNDIRIAKRLQDEEEEQRAQQSHLLRQATRQLEEQDSEYARVIQEELQRCAEEAHRREQEDEEIAKRIQEEEERRVRRRSRGQESLSDDSGSVPASPPPYQHTLSHPHREGQHHSSTATRWQCSTSHTPSDTTGPLPEARRGLAAQNNTTPRSNEGHADSVRQVRTDFREPGHSSEESEESDSVFPEQLPPRSQRWDKRLNTAPCRRRASLHDHPQERYSRGLRSHSSFREESRNWEEERREWDENYEYDDSEERTEGNRGWERNPRGEEYESWHRRRDHDRDSRSGEIRERPCSRSDSVRQGDRDRRSDQHRPREHRHIVRTWTYRETPDRHVRFQEDGRRCNSYHGDNSSRVWEMLGQVLRERGVAVRHSFRGGPLQLRPNSRDSQVSHGNEVSYGDSQPHQRAFQRAAPTRRSYHGDVREWRRSSHRENSERDYREGRHDSLAIEEDDGAEEYEEPHRDSDLANGERRGSRRCKRGDIRHRSRSTREEEEEEEEKEEEERGEIRPQRRVPQRSQSLSSSVASSRARSRHTTADQGARLQSQPEGACLDLGELQQVLRDEELARRLQEEEERLLTRSPQPSPSSPRTAYPEGDFRVAQVAQDEEIARFMQKQEMKSKRRSRELEGPASWREHREMINQHDRRAARERQIQRERLDSEGLPSPSEDYSPENQPPSPVSTTQAQQIRNIAEELDPTFKSRRQGMERVGQTVTGPACQSPPVPHSGLHDFLEEPTFIPPTKRQSDKSGRAKPKEKKENCKQQ